MADDPPEPEGDAGNGPVRVGPAPPSDESNTNTLESELTATNPENDGPGEKPPYTVNPAPGR